MRIYLLTIWIFIMADKLSRQQARQRAGLIAGELAGISPEEPIVFSAKTRQGKEEIWKQIRASAGLFEQGSR
ncbi:MAG: hypothetical protein R6X27_05205 [Candidatus Desulfacyla sp.]